MARKVEMVALWEGGTWDDCHFIEVDFAPDTLATWDELEGAAQKVMAADPFYRKMVASYLWNDTPDQDSEDS